MHHALACILNAQRIVIFTGAGVSANAPANIPTYAQTGLKWTRAMLDERSPEYLAFKKCVETAEPTATHRFCAALHAMGKLKRVYTQNIDGLHERVLPADMVVTVHGNFLRDEVVCFGEDPFKTNPALLAALRRDFDNENHAERPDLCLVLGTQLTVFPFQVFPNCVRARACPRFFVNLDIDGIQRMSRLQNVDEGLGSRMPAGTVKFGKHCITKRVDWCTSKSKFRQGQWLVQMDCDAFCTQLLAELEKDVPAVDERGRTVFYDDKKRLHRLNGPAVINPDGSREWYMKGVRQRIDGGPTLVRANGTVEWHDLEGFLHRENKPAAIARNGDAWWFERGRLLKVRVNGVIRFTDPKKSGK
jgi:NAD-dependent SIR2 family protein deacetylase